jgi:hypothetical protein
VRMSSSTVESEYGWPTAVRIWARILSFDTVAGPEYWTSIEWIVGAPCPCVAEAALNHVAKTAKSIATVQPRADPRKFVIPVKMPNPAQH